MEYVSKLPFGSFVKEYDSFVQFLTLSFVK